MEQHMARNCSLIGALGLVVALSLPAFADGGKEDKAAQVFRKAMPDSTLSEKRGGTDQHNNETQIINTNTVNGSVNDVTVLNNITGNNSIDGGAFTGAQGFPMVIQNSGNGVLIQNATVLNVTIEQ
jgi:hypothetical protein